MFYAMTHGLIDTGDFQFQDHLEGIESLNRRAEKAEFPVTAVSLHQYPYIADRYELMPVGASVGDGYGPIVVARGAPWKAGSLVAIPGDRTSAVLYLKLRFGADVRTAVEEFDRIPALVLEGKYDYGLLIHEGQLTYAAQGLTLVEDLGRWWLAETGLPAPLGVNVILKDLKGKDEVTEILRRSIAWAFEHSGESVRHAMKYGRGLDENAAEKFVRMYVNDFTLDLGPRGLAGVREFLKRAVENHLITAQEDFRI